MGKKIAEIFEKIIGNSKVDFSKKIINGTYFIVVVFLVFIVLMSKIITFNIIFPFSYIISFVVFFSFMYFYSKKRKDLLVHTFVIVIFSFAIITFLWFKTSGIQGPALLVSISLLFVLHLILNFKQALALSVLLFVWVLLLFLIGLYNPDLIKSNLPENDLKILIVIAFVFVILLVAFGLILLRKQNLEKIKHLENQITEKNIYKKKITDVENIYNFLFQNTNQGVGFTSLDETFVITNKAADKIFGLENESLVGRNLREFVPSEEFEKIVVETEKRKKNISSDYRLNILSADKKLKIIEVTATPVKDVDFFEDGTVAIFRDVTQIENLQNELLIIKQKAEESARLKAVFLSNLSHEIRTPMNSIIGYAELIERKLSDKEYVLKNIEIIKSDAKQLMSILNDIIDLSKFTVGDIKVVKDFDNLNLFIYEQFNFFKSYKSFIDKEITFRLDTNIPEKFELYTDFSILKTILKQLLYNAFKYTEKGEIILSCIINNNLIEFAVTDTGIGIAQDVQKFIFDIFRQADERTARKYGGNGIGLTMVKYLCAAIDSEINLFSETNRGSKFWFILKK
ncbi:MAG: PAS domain S-box protein [Bacteroidales bacterium]|nr:PAS domain S-box protein [Bacteroidales bacterium]